MIPLPIANCVAQRLRVNHASSGRLVVELGGAGTVCIGIGRAHDFDPVLVVGDEGLGPNACPETLLPELATFLAAAWRASFVVQAATVVLRSASDSWDVAFVTWSRDGWAKRVDMAPLRFPGSVPRSEAAFLAAFGPQATRALQVLFRMRVEQRAYFTTMETSSR